MQAETQGMTVVPLKAYFNDQSKVKFQIGLARGKNVRDKRADNIKERDTKRERRRIIIFFYTIIILLKPEFIRKVTNISSRLGFVQILRQVYRSIFYISII